MAGGRLGGLAASSLPLEKGGPHMHVGAVMLLEGAPPSYDGLVEATEARLHLVPRYRQKLAFVPFGQGRPRWVDDPHLNLRYHIRRTALPPPGSEPQLRALAGRVFSQPLDRDKPLWEMWLGRASSRARRAPASLSSARRTTRSSMESPAWTSSACCLTSRPSAPSPPSRHRAGCHAPSRRRRSSSGRPCSSGPSSRVRRGAASGPRSGDRATSRGRPPSRSSEWVLWR